MELQLLPKLRQEIRLAQVIDFANLINVPDEVLETIIGAISFKPESIEAILQGKRTIKEKDTSHDVQSLYNSLIPPENGVREMGSGLIISPNLKVLETCLEQYQTAITPDATYIGRRGEKPEIVFSDHLKGSMGLRVIQVDGFRYPETAKLIAKLKKFDEWKKRTLRDEYTFIGEVQREFFEDLDRTKLHIFGAKDLAEKLGFAECTIYRTLSNRWVEARSATGEQRLIHSDNLLVTPNELRRYLAIPRLNELLIEEFKKGKACSDQELAGRISAVARRTVTKYRQEAKIPNSDGRNDSYQIGKGPYQIV